MTKKQSTKRSLIASILVLCLCFTSLIGTTFAWFTDSVTSANNLIQSGNLDIALDYWDGDSWETVQGTDALFSDNLWEPGHTEVVYLKLSNLGSLALKYQLSINVLSETKGINRNGDVFKLSDYIRMGVVDGKNGETDAYAKDAVGRAQAIAEAGKTNNIGKGYAKSGTMLADADELYMAVVVYMPTSVGNEANAVTGTTPPTIHLGVNVIATQYTAESDSFGNTYDETAPWTGLTDTAWYNSTDTSFTLTKAEELAGLATLVNAGNSFEGKTVTLAADVDLNNVRWTPIGVSGAPFRGTFIGTGYTIKNLKAVGEAGVGLFGRTHVGAHIEGVTVIDAYVSGNDYVGVIVGGGYLARNCIKNCVVENATVIATPIRLADGTYDGGAKAGAIVGQAYNGNIIGNTAKNVTVTAYRDLGGIVGMLDFDGKDGNTVEASGNTVENVTLNYIGVAGRYDKDTPNRNMGAIVGRVGSKAIVSEDANTATGVEQNEANKDAIMIYTLEELIAFANDVNSGNTYKGKTVILGADIDLLNMEWTPIGTGAGFKGIFDGNGKTISNLKITGNKSTVGLFANTYDGEIKNLTVENATVSGYLNVGVVAGNPYTSKYTNITVKGHVEVNGMTYVGGVGGKNAYTDWTDITVDVDETSYVKAISTENGAAYRTYVGGVVGFNGEGGHTFKNITTNIDVIGDVCDIGGVFGIAHYNNKFENIICTGNVTNLVSTENDGDDAATDVLETGLIAGTWHNENGTTVTFTNISATGTISAPNVTPADAFANQGLIGKKYSASKTGVLIIDGKDTEGNWAVTDAASMENALTKGGDVKLYKDVALTEVLTIANGTTVELNLNGKMLSTGLKTEGRHHYAIDNYGTLTLTGDGAIHARGVENFGIMIIDGDLTITNVDTNGGSAIWNEGVLTVYNGTFTTNETAGAGSYGSALNNQSNGIATIYGGTYVANSNLTYAVFNYGGKMTIYDSNVTGKHGAVFGADVYGGTYTQNNNLGVADWCAYDCTLYGGTYSAENDTSAGGGVFYDVTIAEGYTAIDNGDGTYTVLPVIEDVTLTYVADGLYTDGTNYYIANAAGLKAANDLLASTDGRYSKGFNRSYILLNDVDASDITWKTAWMEGNSTTDVALTLDGQGHTIRNLTTTGALLSGNSKGAVIKNITFDNVTVESAGYHVAVIWGEAYGSMTLQNVSVKNSSVTGKCNVAALVGSTAQDVTVTYENCSVENTVIASTGAHSGVVGDWACDPTGANIFMGRALGGTKLAFTGCTSNGNTVTNQNGLVGGGIYGYTAISNGWWTGTGSCDTFTDWNGLNAITPDNIDTITIESDTVYSVAGDFNGSNVHLVMPVGVENVVFDGASASNINELIITQNGQLIDNASEFTGKERSGKVAIQNFNVASQINVFACNTEVEIAYNTAEALMVYAGNCALNIHHNEIDANDEAHTNYSSASATWGNANKYGISLMIFQYELKIDNNVVKNARSHAIGINGCENFSEYGVGATNKIVSFTGNKITVDVTNDNGRAALKIWDDATYASVNDPDNLNATAKAFINNVLNNGKNTFNLLDGYDHVIFNFYNVKTSKAQA